jgi:hypothetical protein
VAPQPILTVKSGLICGKLSLNRHCISGKNDTDQKRGSRLPLAAIALANPDGHRLALVPILHCTAEAMTRPPAVCCFGHWRFSYFPLSAGFSRRRRPPLIERELARTVPLAH